MDADSIVGAGHFNRTLQMARKLTQCGYRVNYLVRRPISPFIDHSLSCFRIQYRFLREPTLVRVKDNLDSWLGVHPAQELEEVVTLCGVEKPTLLIVDHYGYSPQMVEALVNKISIKIVVFDDFSCHAINKALLIRQFGNHQVGRNIISGPSFLFFSEELKYCRMKRLDRIGLHGRNRVSDLIIDLGTLEQSLFKNLSKMIDYACNQTILNFRRIAIVSLSPCMFRAVTELVSAKRTEKVIYLVARGDQDQYFEWLHSADICFGACGISAWERAYLNLPSFTWTTAENQKKNLQNLSSLGIVRDCGAFEDFNTKILEREMLDLRLKDFYAAFGLFDLDDHGLDRTLAKIAQSDF